MKELEEKDACATLFTPLREQEEGHEEVQVLDGWVERTRGGTRGGAGVTKYDSPVMRK